MTFGQSGVERDVDGRESLADRAAGLGLLREAHEVLAPLMPSTVPRTVRRIW